MSKKRRLDVELLERGLVESREGAKRVILAGQVWIDGQRATKPSDLCAPGVQIEVRTGDRYVSRGGLKLEAALDAFGIDPTGWECLDVGASTGGFTDCLLQRGAARVVALDVGTGQLHWKLRQDPRVEAHEGVNARHLDPSFAPGRAFRMIVADVSFISLRLVLPPVFPMLAPDGHLCALIKPQFEAGREQVGKGGIVRDASVHEQVIENLKTWARDYPVESRAVLPCPVSGRDGNREFWWWLRPKPGAA